MKKLGQVFLVVFCGTLSLEAGLFRSIADYLTRTERKTLGENIELEEGQYFKGKHIVEGGGHTITFLDGGEIIVDSNSTLVMKNMTIKGVTQDNLKCIDDKGKIIVENVTWEIDDTFFFDKGSIEVSNGTFEVKAEKGVQAGEHDQYPTFIYKSCKENKIKNGATVTFDRVWFFHVPYNKKSEFTTFGGANAELLFKDCGIYVNDVEGFVAPDQVDCIGKSLLYKHTKDKFYEKYGVSEESVLLTRSFTDASFETFYDVDEEYIEEVE
jgi:hypothetical protein